MLIATDTIQTMAQHGVSTLRRHNPRPINKGRLMSHVLPVKTSQFSNPVTVVILMKAYDGLLHVLPH